MDFITKFFNSLHIKSTYLLIVPGLVKGPFSPQLTSVICKKSLRCSVVQLPEKLSVALNYGPQRQ